MNNKLGSLTPADFREGDKVKRIKEIDGEKQEEEGVVTSVTLTRLFVCYDIQGVGYSISTPARELVKL